MLYFTLIDLETGEQRTMEAPVGTTEKQVREWYGGTWCDLERTMSLSPVFVAAISP